MKLLTWKKHQCRLSTILEWTGDARPDQAPLIPSDETCLRGCGLLTRFCKQMAQRQVEIERSHSAPGQKSSRDNPQPRPTPRQARMNGTRQSNSPGDNDFTETDQDHDNRTPSTSPTHSSDSEREDGECLSEDEITINPDEDDDDFGEEGEIQDQDEEEYDHKILKQASNEVELNPQVEKIMITIDNTFHKKPVEIRYEMCERDATFTLVCDQCSQVTLHEITNDGLARCAKCKDNYASMNIILMNRFFRDKNAKRYLKRQHKRHTHQPPSQAPTPAPVPRTKAPKHTKQASESKASQ